MPRLVKRCPVCHSCSAQCPECGRFYDHGESAHCRATAECKAANAPIDCYGCGRVVADPPDGVLKIDGSFVPYGDDVSIDLTCSLCGESIEDGHECQCSRDAWQRVYEAFGDAEEAARGIPNDTERQRIYTALNSVNHLFRRHGL